MASVATVRIFRPELNQLLRGRSGPVALHLANTGRQVAGAARRLAPRGSGPGPHLADNISSALVPTPTGLGVRIVADVPHAIYVHRGTKPHDIGSPVLINAGVWRYIGPSPAGRGKQHPGTKPNRFLLRALEAVGLRGREIR